MHIICIRESIALISSAVPYFTGFLERCTENYVQRSILSEDVHFKVVFDAEVLWVPYVSVSRALCRGPAAAALTVMA